MQYDMTIIETESHRYFLILILLSKICNTSSPQLLTHDAAAKAKALYTKAKDKNVGLITINSAAVTFKQT